MQFHRVETHSGAVLVFRQRSADASRRIRLAGLRPTRRYRVFDADGAKQMVLTGAELTGQGLAVSLSPGASAILYYGPTRLPLRGQ